MSKPFFAILMGSESALCEALAAEREAAAKAVIAKDAALQEKLSR